MAIQFRPRLKFACTRCHAKPFGIVAGKYSRRPRRVGVILNGEESDVRGYVVTRAVNYFTRVPLSPEMPTSPPGGKTQGRRRNEAAYISRLEDRCLDASTYRIPRSGFPCITDQRNLGPRPLPFFFSRLSCRWACVVCNGHSCVFQRIGCNRS